MVGAALRASQDNEDAAAAASSKSCTSTSTRASGLGLFSLMAQDFCTSNGSSRLLLKEGGSEVSLQDLRLKLQEFARVRDWDQFHSPRNLLLALVGEVGELSEIFQWKGEVQRGLPGWNASEKEHLGEELSDVLLYLVRLADVCGVDLGQAALSKLKKNAIKYPVENSKSSNAAGH